MCGLLWVVLASGPRDVCCFVFRVSFFGRFVKPFRSFPRQIVPSTTAVLYSVPISRSLLLFVVASQSHHSSKNPSETDKPETELEGQEALPVTSNAEETRSQLLKTLQQRYDVRPGTVRSLTTMLQN